MNLAKHPHFHPWRDPQSGVISHILTERVAPIQMPVYFVNPCVSADERWLWFACGYPPSPYRRLGVVSLDPERPMIRVFQHATFQAETPLITPAGDSCWFASGTAVYEINVEGAVREVMHFPQDFVNHRQVTRVATHLTRSADGRHLLLDGAFAGGRWFVALGEIETGQVTILKEWTRHMNHAQFSPVDPALFSIAQDWWHDPISGQHFPFDQRIWLMDVKGERYEPLRPGDWFGHGVQPCHEWWDAQGRMCWVDYEAGAHRCDLVTREVECVWPRPLCHAHCDATGELWVADETPYRWAERPVEVLFLDRRTGCETAIVSAMPPPPMPRHPLHLDPHPHFTPRGTHVAYMTTVHGTVDVALTEVAPLVGA